tara:strand:- start:256 stop:453 length:198 start_codon:yes stop_codon:yes gene_type:complete
MPSKKPIITLPEWAIAELEKNKSVEINSNVMNFCFILEHQTYNRFGSVVSITITVVLIYQLAKIK